MKKITRRDFLKLSVLTGSTAALAACGGEATEAPEAEAPEAGPTIQSAAPLPSAEAPQATARSRNGRNHRKSLQRKALTIATDGARRPEWPVEPKNQKKG